MKIKLNIAYRIYPKVTKPTFIHEKDKLALAEACLSSMVSSLGDTCVQIVYILDGCPDEYETMVRRVSPKSWAVDVKRVPGLGNKGTLAKQIDLLKRVSKEELVMFAEDDYFYKPGMLARYIGILAASDKWDYATPYRHPDMRSMRQWSTWIKARNGVSGGLDADLMYIPATCMTFICKNGSPELLDPFVLYTRKSCDADLWMAMTTDWIDIVKYTWDAMINGDRFFASISRAALKVKWRLGRQYRLVEPAFNVGTHAEKAFMAEGEDWLTLAKNLKFN